MKIKLLLHTKKYLVSLFIFLFSVNHLMSNYSIDSLVVDTVGNKSTGGTYELFSAGGQSVIGNSSGGSYNMETGFIGATDNVPPTDIVNLTALQGLSVGQIILKWTAHGDDKDIGNIWQGQYEIKYTSMAIITNSNYDNPPDPTYTITISTSYSTPLQEHTTTVYNLKQGTSYWFAIKMRDEANNWSVWNSSQDIINVNTDAYNLTKEIKAITNLSVSIGSYVGTIKMTWTYPETLAVGSSYYIQYSTYSDIIWNYDNAQIIVSTSITAGDLAIQIVGGFDVGRGSYPSYNIISPDYYFRIWITTGSNAFSEFSNSAYSYAFTPNIGINIKTDYSDGWISIYNGDYHHNDCGKRILKDDDGNIYATFAKTGTKESQESVDVVDIAPIYGKAIENFNAYSHKKNIDICTCGRFTDTLKVTNTGSTTTHYIIKKGGSAAKFVSYLPTELLLNPSETQSINMVGNVPCLGAAGSYTLQTYFETLAGSSKILSQQLNIIECDLFKAYPAYPSYKNAPCTPTSYNINIQNLKNIPDTFKLSFDNNVGKAYYFNKADNINKAYYKFTESFVLLAPKEQKTTSLIINLPCEFSETYKFNVKVSSTITRKEQTFPLYLTIDKNGYSFGLDLGYPVKIENYTKKVSFAVKPNNFFSFCSSDVQLIPVRLTNLADFSNTYKISLISKSDDDVFKTPVSVALLPKQSALLNNYYYAAEEELGNHTYALQVISEKGKLIGKLPITVEVKDCTKVDNVGLEHPEPKKYTALILLLFVFILISVCKSSCKPFLNCSKLRRSLVFSHCQIKAPKM